jgi:hypothetical protein
MFVLYNAQQMSQVPCYFTTLRIREYLESLSHVTEMNRVCYFDCDAAIVVSNLNVSPCRVDKQSV